MAAIISTLHEYSLASFSRRAAAAEINNKVGNGSAFAIT